VTPIHASLSEGGTVARRITTDGLTAKQRLFALYYACTGEGVEAARQAGYSEASLVTKPTELLNHPDVQSLITRIRADIIKRSEAKAFDVLRELRILAGSDIGNYIRSYDPSVPIEGQMVAETDPQRGVAIIRADDPELMFRTLEELTPECRRAIKKLEKKVVTIRNKKDDSEIRHVTYTLELWDKVRPLEMLGRWQGLWGDSMGRGDPRRPGASGPGIPYGPVLVLPDNGRGLPPGMNRGNLPKLEQLRTAAPPPEGQPDDEEQPGSDGSGVSLGQTDANV
jgi:phage terminase small subunit